MQFLHGYHGFDKLNEAEVEGFFAQNNLSGVEIPAYTSDLLKLTPSGVAYQGYGVPAYTVDSLNVSNISAGLSSYNEVPPVFGLEGFRTTDGIWSTIKNTAKKVGGAVISAPGAAFDTVKGAVTGDKKAKKKLTGSAKSLAKDTAKAEIKKATGITVPAKLDAAAIAKQATSKDAIALVQKGSGILSNTKKKVVKRVAGGSTATIPAAAPVAESTLSTGMLIGGAAALVAVGGGLWYLRAKKKSKR